MGYIIGLLSYAWLICAPWIAGSTHQHAYYLSLEYTSVLSWLCTTSRFLLTNVRVLDYK